MQHESCLVLQITAQNWIDFKHVIMWIVLRVTVNLIQYLLLWVLKQQRLFLEPHALLIYWLIVSVSAHQIVLVTLFFSLLSCNCDLFPVTFHTGLLDTKISTWSSQNLQQPISFLEICTLRIRPCCLDWPGFVGLKWRLFSVCTTSCILHNARILLRFLKLSLQHKWMGVGKGYKKRAWKCLKIRDGCNWKKKANWECYIFKHFIANPRAAMENRKTGQCFALASQPFHLKGSALKEIDAVFFSPHSVALIWLEQRHFVPKRSTAGGYKQTLLKANLQGTSMAYKHSHTHTHTGIAKKCRPGQMDAHVHSYTIGVKGLRMDA